MKPSQGLEPGSIPGWRIRRELPVYGSQTEFRRELSHGSPQNEGCSNNTFQTQ